MSLCDDEIGHIDLAHRRGRVVLAQTIHERPARNPEEPGTKLRAVAKLAEAPQDTEPDVLGDLVRDLVGVGQPAHVLPDRAAPAGDELVEGGPLAELAADDQPFVFSGARVGVRGVSHGSFSLWVFSVSPA